MNIRINTRSIAPASPATRLAALRPVRLPRRCCRRQRLGGFTLIELLVSVTIIGIIAAFSAGVIYTGQEAARRTASEAIISKLHSQMAMRWEDYGTRRVGVSPLPSRETRVIAAQRVMAIQELMRLELPDQYIDIFDPTDATRPPQLVALQAVPSLSRAYRRRVSRQVIQNPNRPPDDWDTAFEYIASSNQSAECLFLIMTTGMIDETAGGEFFSGRETGDTDGDGMFEFIDGWGRPIEWLRWPTAFLSDLQPGTVLSEDVSGQQQIGRNVDANRDPFNPTLVDEQGFVSGLRPRDLVWGYRLTPLIMSPGGDGFKGFRFVDYRVSDGPTSATNVEILTKASDPYAVIDDELDGPVRRADVLLDPSKGSREDNIHNHLIGTR